MRFARYIHVTIMIKMYEWRASSSKGTIPETVQHCTQWVRIYTFFFVWSHSDVTPKWQDELHARSLFTFAIPDSAEVAWVWRHAHTRSNTQNTCHGQALFQTTVLQLAVRASFIHYPVFFLGWQLSWSTTSPTLTEPEGILRDTRSPHRLLSSGMWWPVFRTRLHGITPQREHYSLPCSQKPITASHRLPDT